LWRNNDKLTWRKLGVLVAQLPPESATSTALRLDADLMDRVSKAPHDPEREQWSRMEQLIASVRDELQALRHHYLTMHSQRKLNWNPEPLPRPGVGRRGHAAVSDEQTEMLRAHLAKVQGEDEE
jgi:hypothetical protein